MNLIEKILAKAITEKVRTAAVLTISDHMESTHSVDALINKSTSNNILVMKRRSNSFKHGFTVFDGFNNKKYIVKPDFLSFGRPCIRLYDIKNDEIGKVGLTSNTGMGTYTISLDGKVLGTVTRKVSLKMKLELNLNGWHMDGDFLYDNITVTDINGNQIMKSNKAFSASRESYVIQMANRQHEIICLLLIMAVEIILHGNE